MQNWAKSNTGLSILEERRNAESIELDILTPRDIFQLQGHFPGNPVVPGVAQLDWAVRLGRAYFEKPFLVQSVSQLKYKALWLPEYRVTLELSYFETKNLLKFKYFNSDLQFSSATIKLANG